MSDEARARNMAREARIWRPFSYSRSYIESEIAERAIIYGLYSNSYLNGQAYLKEIEDAELANMLTDYTNKLAELTVQEQLVVADIVSKRYLAGIDKLIHDEKMITEQQKIDNANALADARYAALASDRAALETMAAKVASEIEKNAARITELTAQIAIEGANYDLQQIDIAEKQIQSNRVDVNIANAENQVLHIQSQQVRAEADLLRKDIEKSEKEIQSLRADNNIVNAENDILHIQTQQIKAEADLVRKDIEKAEKELQSLRVDNQKLDVANEILRIQIQTVRTATELLDIDVQMARTRVNIADTQRAIAKINLLPNELAIEKAKTLMMENEKELYTAKSELEDKRKEEADAEKDFVETTLTDQEEDIHQAKNDLIDLKDTVRNYQLEKKVDENALNNDLRKESADSDKTIATDNKTSQAAIDAPGGPKMQAIAQGGVSSWARAMAAVRAAEDLAKAEIATKLTHVIQKAT